MAVTSIRPLTRQDLAKFLPDQRAIKAFEGLFNLVPQDLTDLDGRIGKLENPGVIVIATDHEAGADNPVVVVGADGLTVTLPKCSDAIKGRIWSISLNVAGAVTINTQGGDTFTTPANDAETTLILNRRGSVIDMRCISDNQWVFV